jgi:acyl carrier protein
MSLPSFEVFCQIVQKQLSVETKDFIDAPLQLLPEFDSLGKIRMSIVVEDAFGFELDYELMKQFKTLKELYVFCETHENY